jgi:hypothetical protein
MRGRITTSGYWIGRINLRTIGYMQDSRRTVLRWLGTIAGVALIVLGVHTVLIQGSLGCRSSGVNYVCSGHPSGHPHTVLGLLLGAVGLAILAGSRRYLSYYGPSRAS